MLEQDDLDSPVSLENLYQFSTAVTGKPNHSNSQSILPESAVEATLKYVEYPAMNSRCIPRVAARLHYRSIGRM